MWNLANSRRQGQIPPENLDSSWQEVIKPFVKVRSSPQLYDAGRTSLAEVLRAATGKSGASQDEIIELLAGPQQTAPDEKRMHQEVANRIRAVMDGQRLVSLDTLMALGQGLNEKARGKPVEDGLLNLAGQLANSKCRVPFSPAASARNGPLESTTIAIPICRCAPT